MNNNEDIDKEKRALDLFKKNRGLVFKIADLYRKKYYLAENIVDDLKAVGDIVLYRAMQKYDPTRGVKPRTFAFKHVYFEMLKFLKKNVFPKPTPRTPLHSTFYRVFLFCYPKVYVDWINELPDPDRTVLKMIIGRYNGTFYSRKRLKEELEENWGLSLYQIKGIEAKRRREFLNFVGIFY